MGHEIRNPASYQATKPRTDILKMTSVKKLYFEPRIVIPVTICCAVALLYGHFLENPLVFDDIYFFQIGNPERVAAAGFVPRPRWLSDYSLALTLEKLGSSITWFRVGNLSLHAGTSIAIFVLCRRLLLDTRATLDEDRAGWAAGAAALLFALHPMSVFATGYLIQRSIVMATLFAVLSWLAFWRGLAGSGKAFFASIVFYALSLLSKEHAVMVPAVCALLVILHRCNSRGRQPSIWQIGVCFFAMATLGVLILLQMKGVIATAYEPESARAVGSKNVRATGPNGYLSSVLTQASLFFQYISYWLLPNQAAMAVDIRVPMIDPQTGWRSYTGIAALAASFTAGILLLLRKGSIGLVGLAIAAPAVLYATEFSTIRLQEVFVLYRSYLWAPLLFLLPALAFLKISRSLGGAITAVLACALSLMSLLQLNNFSSSFQLWDTAARLAERSGDSHHLSGMERIYRNRGLALANAGIHTEAIRDFNRAIESDSSFVYAYQARGSSYLELGEFAHALADFDTVLALDPTMIKGYAGRALALDGLMRKEDALVAHQLACKKGWDKSCNIENDSRKK